jgi:phosphoribosylglycinamide formyltransferase-1
MNKKIRIGALISGSGTNLQAIINACESGEIDGQMVFAGADRPGAYGLERAQHHGIPTFTVDYPKIIKAMRENSPEDFLPPDFDLEDIMKKQTLFSPDPASDPGVFFLKTRAAAESRVLEAMKPYPFDLLVLAGFMRNLTPYFIDRVNTDPDLPRIMNIHPALLPAFPGVDGYGDTFRYGCKVGGCTVHFIDYGEDSGPIIGQRAFSITSEDTLESVKEKGLKLEWELFPECIQMFAQNRLKPGIRAWPSADGTLIRRRIVDVIS